MGPIIVFSKPRFLPATPAGAAAGGAATGCGNAPEGAAGRAPGTGAVGACTPDIMMVPLNFAFCLGESSNEHETHFSAWSVLGVPQFGQNAIVAILEGGLASETQAATCDLEAEKLRARAHVGPEPLRRPVA
jgi:hypothetical protein